MGKEDTTQSPMDLALQRCEEQIAWYVKTARRFRRGHDLTQIAVIFLGGLTPVLVVLQALSSRSQVFLTILIALFPATAAILTAIGTAFNLRDNYVRFAQTSEALKSERFKYVTRTTKAYNHEKYDQAALNTFVSRIERIAMQETADWQTLIKEGMELAELREYTSQLGKSRPED